MIPARSIEVEITVADTRQIAQRQQQPVQRSFSPRGRDRRLPDVHRTFGPNAPVVGSAAVDGCGGMRRQRPTGKTLTEQGVVEDALRYPRPDRTRGLTPLTGPRRQNWNDQSGAVLAVAVMALLLLAASLLVGLRFIGPKTTLNRTVQTQLSEHRVDVALIAYAARNNANLPCPDLTGSGVAAASCTATAGAVWGLVPWQTIGLSAADALDQWATASPTRSAQLRRPRRRPPTMRLIYAMARFPRPATSAFCKRRQAITRPILPRVRNTHPMF